MVVKNKQTEIWLPMFLALGIITGSVPSVVTSVPPQAYIVKRIGGDRVNVQYIIPAGASPATYSPTPRQVVAISTCQIYFKVGHKNFLFERRHVNPLLQDNQDISVVNMCPDCIQVPVTDEHDDSIHERHDHDLSSSDPHLWISFEYVQHSAEELCSVLVAIDQVNKNEYQKNCTILLNDIDVLKEKIANQYSSLDRPSFMVYHPVWGYFASEFGVEQIAIEHEGKEPSPADLVRLIQLARSRDIKTIVVQSGFSTKGAEVIANEIGAKILELDPLAYDWLENYYRISNLLYNAMIHE